MFKSEQKCEDIFKHNNTQKCFCAIKMAYSCCFSLRGHLDFLQKCFITATTERIKFLASACSWGHKITQVK